MKRKPEMSKEKQKQSRALYLITPFIVLLLCAGILAAALIKPMDKLKVLLNVAFMDNLKTNGSDDSGLVIKPSDIISDYSGETSETGELVYPSFGEQFAVISCKAFDVDVPVYWGSGQELLEHGACQSPDSTLPGGGGNVVISAHVDTFFSQLDKLKKGDLVTIKTNYGEFRYKITEEIEFKSTENKYVVPSKDEHLTIYTCKKDALTSSDQRFGFIGELAEIRFYSSKEAE